MNDDVDAELAAFEAAEIAEFDERLVRALMKKGVDEGGELMLSEEDFVWVLHTIGVPAWQWPLSEDKFVYIASPYGTVRCGFR